MFLELKHTIVVPEHSLHPLFYLPAGRFVCGLTLTYPHCVSFAQLYRAVSSVVTELSCRENLFLDMSLEMETVLMSDGLYAVPAAKCMHPIHSSSFLRSWRIQVQSYALVVMQNPETAQVRERVWEGFTSLGPNSCSCTWDRTPVNKENQSLSVTCSHNQHHRPVSDT